MSLEKLYNNLNHNNTLVSILDSEIIPKNSKILIIFDLPSTLYIDFLHVFNSIENRFPDYDFYLGSHKNFNRGGLHEKEISLNSDITLNIFQSPQSFVFGQKYNINILCNEYDYVFNIKNDCKNIDELIKQQIGYIKIIKYNLNIINQNIENKKYNTIIISPEYFLNGKILTLNKNIVKHIYQQISSKGITPILFKLPNSQHGYNFIPSQRIIQSTSNYEIYLSHLNKSLYCFSVYSDIFKISSSLYPKNTCLLDDNNVKYDNREIITKINNFQLSSINSEMDKILKNIRDVYEIENVDINSVLVKPEQNKKKFNINIPKHRTFERKRVSINEINKKSTTNRNITTRDEIISNKFINSNTIIFGPMLMEMGWETMIWSGFIKKYKENNPNKKVIVQTREDRKSLYEGYVDEIVTFNIDNDYLLMSPRTNTNKNLKDLRDKDSLNKILLNDLKNNYSDFISYDFSDIGYSQTPVIDLKKNLYEFKTFENSKKIINDIINKNNNKKIIFLFSRHRKDLNDRNISVNFWQKLYEKLSDFNDCLFLLSGKSPSYIKPNMEYKNIINLEDLEDKENDIDILSLSIEALRCSDYSFGLQSSMLLLSRILKVPSLYIGYDKDMAHSELYNPFNIESINVAPDSVQNSMYVVDTNKVIERLKWFIGPRLERSKESYQIEKIDGIPDIKLIFNKDMYGNDLTFNYNYRLITPTKAIKEFVNPNVNMSKPPITIYTPAGVGDSMWSLQYVIGMTDRPINLRTYKRPGFASRFMLGIKNIISVEEFDSINNKSISFNDFVKICRENDKRYCKLKNLEDIDVMYLEINTSMEKGFRLENQFHNLKSTFNIDWEITETDKINLEKIINLKNQNYIVIYTSSYKNNKSSQCGNWGPDNWTSIYEHLLENLDSSYKIITIGAEYDFDLSKYVFNKLKHERKKELIYINESNSTFVIHLLKNSKALINYQSGIGCMSLTYNHIPTYMLYFSHLSHLCQSFCHPDCVGNELLYMPVLFKDFDINHFHKWLKDIGVI